VGLEERTAAAGLIELLGGDARRFSFFQIVQLAEALGAGEIGRGESAAAEQLRFRPMLTMGHPASEVASAELVTDEDGRQRLLLETTFLGLYGTMSPLPSFYTEDLLHEQGEESLVRGFLDIFHHRLISMFYRCWKKYRHYVQFQNGAHDEFSGRLLALTGLKVTGAEEQLSIPPVRLLRYAGILSQRPCSAAGLRCILTDYFQNIPCEVIEHVPRWVALPDESRCQLGRSGSTLGVDTQLGERVFDRSGKYKVGLGPMGYPTFERFLPGGDNMPVLRQLLRMATADLLAYDVELELRSCDRPTVQLELGSPGSCLGQTTWLGATDGRSMVTLQSYGERRSDSFQPPVAHDGATASAGV